jgi:hypothetical protein
LFSIPGWDSVWRSPQLVQEKRRRCQISVTFWAF